MAVQNFEQWYKDAVEASEGLLSYIALSFVLKWDQMIALAPPALSKENLAKLREQLLFVAFPDLSQAQAVNVLEKGLLHFLASDVDISNALKARYLFVGYGFENKERAVLREAVLRNTQLLGGKRVFEWLQAFDKAFPPERFRDASAGKFFTQLPGISALSKTEQAFLRRLLQVYDEWLRAPLASIYDVVAIYQKLRELERAGVKEVNMDTFERDYLSHSTSHESSIRDENTKKKLTPRQLASFPLLQALSKFENLGNQLITNERIRVKSQQEPVRPSLLYWLKYYRDELGIGQHNSVERGDFLFRSENGRKLSPEERERVSLILKSIEENLPLSIDTDRQEIIFPVSNNVIVAPMGKPIFQGVSVPAQNASRSDAGGMSFSAGHIFPAEKEVIAQKTTPAIPFTAPTPSFRSAPTKKAFDDSNPFIIHPSKEEEIS